MIYNVDIWETPNWTGKFQKFDAVCRETGDSITNSVDPEHEMCRILSRGDAADGEMTTYRSGMASMRFPSVRRAAKQSSTFRNRGSWATVPFRERPSVT